MLRIQYSRYGGPEQMRVDEVEPEKPADSQIRVRVKAASANPVDWKIRSGLTQVLTGWRFPRGMGMDFAGIVEAIGSRVTRFKVGDEVFGAMEMAESSTFAETLITSEKNAAIKPSTLSFEQAAALPVVGATAWIGLIDKAHLQAGQSVYVTGCMGCVGRAVVQISQMLGAEVAGNCSSASLDEAHAMGVSPVEDYRSFDSGKYRQRFDVVFDTPGSLSLQQSASMLKPSGVVVQITPTPSKMLGILLSAKQKLVFGQPTPEILGKLAEAVTQGKLLPLIGRTVPLAQAVPALIELETRSMPKGKLIIVPTNN